MRDKVSTSKPALKFTDLIRPYSDKELEDIDEEKIEALIRFFDETGIDYEKFNRESVPKLQIDFAPKKKAYPNNETYVYIPGQHDVQKWLQAVREIYQAEHNGEYRQNAIRKITANWNRAETYDFLNWIKFYEAGDHMKYKFAAWYESPDVSNYYLPNKQNPAPEKAPAQNFDFAKEKAQQDSERRDLIEKQRSKIISRLDSAEKLLRSPDGHVFSGQEFESLLEAIYDLKKKIQTVNKISTSTRIYQDMIVRQANILNRGGFKKASNVLYALADDPNIAPPVPPAAGPTEPSGAPSGIPSGGSGMPEVPLGEGVDENQPDPGEITSPALVGFLKGIEGDKSAIEDELESEDNLEVSDQEDDLLVSEAQAVAPDEPITTETAPAPLNPTPAPTPKPLATDTEEEPLEVSEEDIEPKPEDVEKSNFNSRMDQVLSGVAVTDVIAELEDLDKIFKTREIPRRLGKVDMMLDSLGLVSFFPTLSEATNKSLEANNYIASRIEDILSKLRGTLATKDVDLKGEDTIERPDMAGIKGKLQEDQDKEKARKQMRKDQETAELESKTQEAPEVEIEEDLAPPAEAPAPPPAKPPVPPA